MHITVSAENQLTPKLWSIKFRKSNSLGAEVSSINYREKGYTTTVPAQYQPCKPQDKEQQYWVLLPLSSNEDFPGDSWIIASTRPQADRPWLQQEAHPNVPFLQVPAGQSLWQESLSAEQASKQASNQPADTQHRAFLPAPFPSPSSGSAWQHLAREQTLAGS